MELLLDRIRSACIVEIAVGNASRARSVDGRKRFIRAAAAPPVGVSVVA